jgi:hypothetical protein
MTALVCFTAASLKHTAIDDRVCRFMHSVENGDRCLTDATQSSSRLKQRHCSGNAYRRNKCLQSGRVAVLERIRIIKQYTSRIRWIPE